MRVVNIEGTNFLSYSEIELSTDSAGVVLVTGVNGSGKSAAIVEALTWALYGKTLRGVTGDAVIHDPKQTGKGKNCVVALTFYVGETKYEVVRFRKLKGEGSGVRAYRHNGDDDTDDLTAEDARATDDRIEQITGVPWSVFVNSVVFGAGNVVRFVDASDADRKAIFDRIVGTERFAAAREVTAKRRSAVETEITNKAVETASASALVDHINAEIDRMERRREAAIATEHDKIKQHEVDKRRLTERLRASEAARVEDDTERDRLMAVEDGASAALLEASVELEDAKNEDRELSEQQNGIEKEIAKLDLVIQAQRNAISNAKRTLQQIEQQAGNVDTELASLDKALCDKCGQQLPEDQIKAKRTAAEALGERLATEYENALAQITSSEGKLEKADHDRKHKATALGALQGVLATRHPRLRLVQKAHQEAAACKQAATQQVRAWRNRRTETEAIIAEIDSIKAQIVKAETAIEAALAVIAADEWLTEIVDKNAEMLEKRRIREGIAGEVAALRLRKSALDFWFEAFGPAGLRSLLLDSVLPFLNERASRYAAALSNGTMRVAFDTETATKGGAIRDKIDVRVEVDDGAGCYAQASSGQRQRADIAIMLALRALALSRTRAGVNLLVLDECFDHLDADGVEGVVDLLLTEISEEGGTIYLTTHSDALAPLFPRRLHVERVNGTSSIS